MIKQILYDANFSVGSYRGMGKYINTLCDVLKSKHGLEVKGVLRSGITGENCTSFGFRNYILWEQISLLKYVSDSNAINLFPYNTAPIFLKKSDRNILIIHDLIYFQKYETKSLKQLIGIYYRRFVVPFIIKKFDHIITVSNYSKKELIERFGLNSELISVIPNCVEFDAKNENPSFEERENVIFHIGGEPDYKNTKTVLLAYGCLPDRLKKIFKVKIVGIKNPKSLRFFKTITAKFGIDEKVEFLPYQTDEQIKILYQTSKIFIFPSYFEGFGIPIIESYKYGCPLICSNRSCLPEVAGNAARYFNPDNFEELSEKIIQTIENKYDTEENINKGYEQLSKYSKKTFDRIVSEWYKSYCSKFKVF